jgi:hypothetical protein
MSKVLNVGGNCKGIKIPEYYDGWEHHLLDIDPTGQPDICCDALLLKDMPEYKGQYDSVYCSHNLEHFYQHNVKDVLVGFHHVLTDDGFCHIRVPHLMNVLRMVVAYNKELTDTLYNVTGGPICAHDIIFGWQLQVRESGNDFFAHKCGFSPKMLTNEINNAGFKNVYIQEFDFELRAYAFKNDDPNRDINAIVKLFLNV